MADAYIGEIRMWGPTFAPRNWAFCNGQLIQIAQNPALFSILGTTYGGDGRTTFGLPDLRGRFATHQGRGPGLTQRRLGERFGTETVTLNINQIPQHAHGTQASGAPARAVDPTGNLPAAGASPGYGAPVAGASLGGVADVGGGQPHPNLPPFLVVNFIICLTGIFPSRA